MTFPVVSINDTRLPVTLLSGFLGAGKTTLLEYILRSKQHGLKCAVIVNDIGALNIDSALLKNHNVTQKEETVVQMQNGCICCTLRGDLLEEIASLAEKREFDYLIIESTGISEPLQVAETFTTEFTESIAANEIGTSSLPNPEFAFHSSSTEQQKKLAEILSAGGLTKISRLDTCVTVVDVANFLDEFETFEFLSQRFGKEAVGDEDERNITDLMVDQIEFANVILLNKTDLVSKEHISKVKAIVTKLNPLATIIETVKSKVDLKLILNTKRFSFEEAATGAGWLQSLKESNRVKWVGPDGAVKWVPKPETEEYGISSFVYRARRPFHPERLWKLMCQPFVVIQNEFVQDGEDNEEEEEEEDDDDDDEIDVDSPQLDLPGRLVYKKASPIFKSLLRSKGFAWLATRPRVHGEWSQAVFYTLTGGTRWLCEENETDWPMADDPKVVAAIKADFEGKWGDRRQEIVFIGEKMDKDLLKKAIDGCLLDDEEWTQWQKVMSSKKTYRTKLEALNDLFADGWEDWIDPAEEEDLPREAEERERIRAERQNKLAELKKQERQEHGE